MTINDIKITDGPAEITFTISGTTAKELVEDLDRLRRVLKSYEKSNIRLTQLRKLEGL